MFVNCSNFKCFRWSEEQREAAKEYGELKEIPFPVVKATTTEEEIIALADKTVGKIMELKPDVVLCQGEFTLSFAIVERLKKAGVTVVTPCSERVVSERKNEDGNVEKTVHFEFVGFRKYV